MTPREIIAKVRVCTNGYSTHEIGLPFADEAIEALISAGYLIEPVWQPIDTAPKDGTEILGAWSYLYEGDTALTEGVEIISWYTGKIDGWLGKDGVAGEGVFHSWMPVPTPPAIRALAKEKQG